MRDRTIKELSTGGSTIIRVKLTYNMGGQNYFTYKNEERGLYLSVSPLSVSQGDGYQTVSYTAFTGVKKLLKPLKRFSQKQLDTFEPDAETVDRLVQHVLDTNNLKLEQ